MREIKFRAWDRHTKRMVMVNMIDFGLRTNNPYIQLDNRLAGDLKDLMQFTGLKDKQGKEIYESDIVEVGYSNGFSWGTDYFKAKVIFENGCFYLEVIGKKRKYIFGEIEWDKIDSASSFNVIGNIYENPELLKEEK